MRAAGLYAGTAKMREIRSAEFAGARVHDPDRRSFPESRQRARKNSRDVAFVFVDMHAETTSEKIAMGWYLDGR